MSSRVKVSEITRRLEIGRQKVYQMLEAGIIPSIRVGRSYIISRHAFEEWWRVCGTNRQAALEIAPVVEDQRKADLAQKPVATAIQ